MEIAVRDRESLLWLNAERAPVGIVATEPARSRDKNVETNACDRPGPTVSTLSVPCEVSPMRPADTGLLELGRMCAASLAILYRRAPRLSAVECVFLL